MLRRLQGSLRKAQGQRTSNNRARARRGSGTATAADTLGSSRSLIWINEPTKVFIARRGMHELTTTILTVDEVRDLCDKMLKSSGRRVDLSTPFVEANM